MYFYRIQVKIIDFTHPNSSFYWENELKIFYEKLKFDGIWLDMNEISNFINGNVPSPFDDMNNSDVNITHFNYKIKSTIKNILTI